MRDGGEKCSKGESTFLSFGLKRIEFGLFGGSALESIIVPEGVEYISFYAFGYCKGLRIIYFPSTIKSIWVIL